MTKAMFIKELGSLRPDSESAFKLLGKIKNGAHVLADVKDMTRRSNKQTGYWFVLRDILFEAQESFEDAEIYRQYILIRMGFCDIFNGPDGPVAIAHSLQFHKMQPPEFGRLVDATLDFGVNLGHDRESLEAKAKERSR